MEDGIAVEGKVVVSVIRGLLSFAGFVTKDEPEAGITTGGAPELGGDLKEKFVLGSWLVISKLFFSEVETVFSEVGPEIFAVDEYGGGLASPNNEVEEGCLLIDGDVITTGGLTLVVEADEKIDLILASSAE